MPVRRRLLAAAGAALGLAAVARRRRAGRERVVRRWADGREQTLEDERLLAFARAALRTVREAA